MTGSSNSEHRSAWIGFSGAIVAAIVGAVVTGGFGLIDHSSANSPLPTVSRSGDRTQPTASDPEPAPGPTTATATQVGGSVRREGGMTIDWNTAGTDLDADLGDPQWGRQGKELQGRAPTDLQSYANRAYGPQLDPGDDATITKLGPTPANYASCRSNAAYSSTPILERDLKVGEFVCVLTDEGRYAAMVITAVDDKAISLNVVVYDS